ncbi:hypothetical protein [Novosphingobium sp.]|uniref:hypothetical protein n=1 Tax=Novosphingobium sp. TaxID=1874826 RepID=UPI00261DEDB6|nr:hypothetical protein [Novosphingobium sp.]
MRFSFRILTLPALRLAIQAAGSFGLIQAPTGLCAAAIADGNYAALWRKKLSRLRKSAITEAQAFLAL